jgi:hypothetical protein
MNLWVHVLTVPVFMAGSVVAASSPFTSLAALPAGLLAMALALAAQGRGHRQETSPPAKFSGPADFVLRIFAEQWITFPRFVLSGELARALGSGSPAPKCSS